MPIMLIFIYRGEVNFMDILYLGTMIVLFVVSWLFVKLAERV